MCDAYHTDFYFVTGQRLPFSGVFTVRAEISHLCIFTLLTQHLYIEGKYPPRQAEYMESKVFGQQALAFLCVDTDTSRIG